jgi:hypothetical protein
MSVMKLRQTDIFPRPSIEDYECWLRHSDYVHHLASLTLDELAVKRAKLKKWIGFEIDVKVRLLDEEVSRRYLGGVE